MLIRFHCFFSLSLLVAVVLGLIQPSAVQAQSATLIQTIDTSQWNPPSPDPAGVTYIDTLGRLLLSDSEVNEIPALFTGDNLFESSLNGLLLNTLTSVGFNNEPTGVSYNPANDHIFISRDNSPKGVFELNPGPDGLYDTNDDIVTFITSSLFGSNDPEGVAFNTTQGTLHIIDGINNEVYTVNSGNNGVFDGVAAEGGDDIVTSFDTAAVGITDPEGIAYDPDFGHLYIVGRPSSVVAHVTTSGTLLRTISISVASPDKPAGLVIAPATAGQGNSLYIVDRGVDNNSDPNENDGKLYEFSLPAFGGNSPPSVTISQPSDGTHFLTGDPVTFTGTADDPEDGDISAQLQWTSNVDGPLNNGSNTGPTIVTSTLSTGPHSITASVDDSGSPPLTSSSTISVVIDQTPNSPPDVTILTPPNNSTFLSTDGINFSGAADDAEDGDLSASLSWSSDIDGSLGTGASILTTLSASANPHVVTATAVDSGDLPGSSTTTVNVDEPAGNNVTFEIRVASAADDAEERPSGNLSFNSSDLELTTDGSRVQVVGMRFNNVLVPQNAGIVDAYIQFQADETGSTNTELSIQGEAVDTASPFVGVTNNISDRPTTAASVAWSPPPWNIVGESGTDQRTPSLQGPLQEIVSRPGWTLGNSLAVIVRGTGKRTAESFNGNSGAAPLLHIVYTTGNTPPVVNAGNDDSVAVTESISLAGSASDDGNPNPPATVTTQWSKVSGPGTVSFSSPGSLNPTATFTEVGNYILQLVADDSVLQGTDLVTITVTPSAGNSPPVVFAGDDATVAIPSAYLFGSVTDDGIPSPPGVVTTLWSQLSGPGTVVFTPTDAPTTTADFSDSGIYTLQLIADDSELQSSDDVIITVLNNSGGATVDVRVANNTDDAEEKANGEVSHSSSDLELVFDKSDQTVGMRFNGLTIPPGSTVTNAFIQFQVDEVSTAPTNLLIQGEATDNAVTFAGVDNNISSRPVTSASVSWIPEDWNTKNVAGPDQQTPDISTVIQEIVNQPGWNSGNSLVIVISGTGERVAESYNGSNSGAPLLHVDFQVNAN